MRYWNALLYGSKETKIYLWSILIGAVLTVSVSVFAIVRRSWIAGLIALFFGIVTLIIWQSKNLADHTVDRSETGKEKEPKRTALSQETKEKDTKKGKMKKEKKVEKEEKEEEEEEIEGEEEELMEISFLEKIPEMEEAEEEVEETEEIEEIEEAKEEEPEELEPVSDYKSYSASSLKKAMHHYKVKRLHRPVMIDSCKSQGILECPAYLWKDRHKVYLLLLEKKPRRIEYPLEKMTFLDYQRGVEARPDQEYPAFHKSSPVAAVFKPFLPDYYQQRRNGTIYDLKNLYVMAGDLAFTNTSVKNVMAVLEPGFRVRDEMTTGGHYGAYFIESYQKNILLRDGVLEVEEYKTWIRELLLRMAQEKMSLREFRRQLEELVEHRLITEEFADYFLEYRAKLDLIERKP